MLIYNLGYETLSNISLISLKLERGRRREPYNVFKWWGRRFVVLSRAILAALVAKSEEEIVAVAKGNYDIVRGYTKGKTIYDPFCGGGTIAIEAGLMGYNAICRDINVAAIATAKATYKLCKESLCQELYQDLVKALLKTFDEAKDLWCINNTCILHVFATRCTNKELCRVPLWLSTKVVKGKRIPIVIDEDGSLKLLENFDSNELKPTNPCYYVDPNEKDLPIISENVYAYAVEVYDINTYRRRFVSLLKNSDESMIFKDHLRESYEYSLRRLRSLVEEGTPIPLLRETKRLFKSDVDHFEDLFTPRQLLTFITFIGNASNRFEASLIVANAMRTASLLAIYYQPYGKVNPSLVIKSYWLPLNPVELNPLAFKVNGMNRITTLGRGTLATYIKEIYRTCKYSVHGNSLGSVVFDIADSLVETSPPNIFAVVTDPPYIGKQSYRDMSLLYLYSLKLGKHIERIDIPEDIDTYSQSKYIKAMESFANTLTNLENGVPIIILMGMPSRKNIQIISSIVSIFSNKDLGLINMYWIIGEAPGILGRSTTYGVLIMVFKKGSNIAYPIIEEQINKLEIYKKKLTEMLSEENLHRIANIIDLDNEFELYRALLKMILNQNT